MKPISIGTRAVGLTGNGLAQMVSPSANFCFSFHYLQLIKQAEIEFHARKTSVN